MRTFLVFLLLSIGNASCFAQHNFSEGLIVNQGDSIYYKVFGNGKPVLIFNGGPGYSSDHMQGVAEKLADGYKVILFDQRGTGKSKVSIEDSIHINVASILKDVTLIIAQLGFRKIHIMGHSFGGILAMSFAVTYPEKVEKLILSSSAGINLTFLNYFGDNIAQRLCPATAGVENVTQPNSLKEREEAFYRAVTNNAPAYLYKKEHVDVLIKRLTVRDSYNPNVNFLLWQDLGNQQYDLSTRFTNFKSPTLIIQGRQDILGDETAIRIKEAIRQSKLIFINQCGHVPWIDQPEKYFSELKAFLN